MRSERRCAVVAVLLVFAATPAPAPADQSPRSSLSERRLIEQNDTKKRTERTSIHFTGPAGMTVAWQSPDGSFSGDADSLTAPKEFNFAQGKTYRLRVARVAKDKPGEAFYPTLEVAPATPRSRVFLAHTSVPVAFTADDFEQARKGCSVVKVMYLPDPQFQEFNAVTRAEELVSTKLVAGVDPVAEAGRRGTVLAVIRLDNVNREKRAGPRSLAR